MNMISTPESSNIANFGYDEKRQVLRVEFRNGSVYEYFDIPSQVFQEMERAGSKGSYLAQNIKGRFRYART